MTRQEETEGGRRQRDLCEFEINLIYSESSRPARATKTQDGGWVEK